MRALRRGGDPHESGAQTSADWEVSVKEGGMVGCGRSGLRSEAVSSLLDLSCVYVRLHAVAAQTGTPVRSLHEPSYYYRNSARKHVLLLRGLPAAGLQKISSTNRFHLIPLGGLKIESSCANDY